MMTKCGSPQYNHIGWLGVKHQFTYLLTSPPPPPLPTALKTRPSCCSGGWSCVSCGCGSWTTVHRCRCASTRCSALWPCCTSWERTAPAPASSASSASASAPSSRCSKLRHDGKRGDGGRAGGGGGEQALTSSASLTSALSPCCSKLRHDGKRGDVGGGWWGGCCCWGRTEPAPASLVSSASAKKASSLCSKLKAWMGRGVGGGGGGYWSVHELLVTEVFMNC